MTVTLRSPPQPDFCRPSSHAPKAHPWRVSAEVEAVICDLRAAHCRWGRPGTAQPPRLPQLLVVTRRVSVHGSVMDGGQKIQSGLALHAIALALA